MQAESYWLDTRWLGGSKHQLKLEVVQIEPIVQIEIGVIHIPWKHWTDPVPRMQPGFKEWPNKNKLRLNWKLSSPVGKNRGKWTTMRPPKVPPLQSKPKNEPTATRKQCQSLLSTLLSMAGTCSERDRHRETVDESIQFSNTAKNCEPHEIWRPTSSPFHR